MVLKSQPPPMRRSSSRERFIYDKPRPRNVRELAGIAGTMTILIADGKHSFEFAYTLPGETRT